MITHMLGKVTGHTFVEVTTRGNTAITAALSLVSKDKTVLIPDEGGWLSYRTLPQKFKLNVVEVACREAKMDLIDLEEKLRSGKCGMLLYQHPAGYFAEQNVKKIYELCKRHDCLVVLDISGAIGTSMIDSSVTDIFVCSFGAGKLVNAGYGGMISTSDDKIWRKLCCWGIKKLEDAEKRALVLEQLKELPSRVEKLTTLRNKVLADLASFDVVHPHDGGFVVVVRYASEDQKKKIFLYCEQSGLEWKLCPRYIRLNEPAISVELKRVG